MSNLGTAKNNLVTHGDLGELAYAKWGDIPTYQLPIVDTTVYLRTPIEAYASGSFSTTTTYFTPLLLTEPKALTQLIVRTSLGHTGTTSVRLGIWKDGKGKPSSLIQDAGLVSMTATSTNYTASFTEIVLPAGIYWVGCNAVSASGVFGLIGAGVSTNVFNPLFGAISATVGGNMINGRTESYNATSAFSAAGTTTAATATPFVWAKLT